VQAQHCLQLNWLRDRRSADGSSSTEKAAAAAAAEVAAKKLELEGVELMYVAGSRHKLIAAGQELLQQVQHSKGCTNAMQSNKASRCCQYCLVLPAFRQPQALDDRTSDVH
jgi:hypothetical protein